MFWVDKLNRAIIMEKINNLSTAMTKEGNYFSQENIGGVVPRACPGVKPRIDAGPSAENPSPRIEDAVGGDEHLRRRRRRDVGQRDVEVLHERHVRVRERGPAPLQQQDGVVPRQRGRERATRRPPAHYYVVVGRFSAVGRGGGGRRGRERAGGPDERVAVFGPVG
ncbi:crooked neck protein [Striga asiatica]|uniref:Crooked neck protein n=1 Tax=Striga asiatica TaxID=4170 RepID=A0A5A7R4L9_STRAF|nr:crooked neck protein [Striga asiatica]